MSDAAGLQLLRPILALIGLIAIALWPLAKLWPSGFAWSDAGARSPHFEMICAVYFVLGFFLLVASRRPHRKPDQAAMLRRIAAAMIRSTKSA